MDSDDIYLWFYDLPLVDSVSDRCNECNIWSSHCQSCGAINPRLRLSIAPLLEDSHTVVSAGRAAVPV